MKKLLRIIYDWPPKWDGLAPAPYELTRAQKKLGYDIDIFCGRWPFAGPIAEIEDVKLHPFIREPFNGTLLVTVAPVMFFYYLFWRTRNTPDLIHSHGHFGMWIYGYRLFLRKFFPKAKELKIPLVTHFHNTVKGREEAIESNGGKPKWISKVLSWPLAEKSDRWALEVSDSCIFVSENLRQEAMKFYGANGAKCYVVETGVNPSLFTPIGAEERGKTRKELGFSPADKVILNLGAMVERKNIHLLVEALTSLPPEYKLLLVGDGDSAYQEKISDMIKEKKLGSRVVRAGYTPYPEAHIAYQAADIFVLPSSFEGFPKVVMESLACGVKVLASGFKATAEISGLYYLDNLIAVTIADQVKEILESGAKVDLGVIRSKYSWDYRARQINTIYEKIN